MQDIGTKLLINLYIIYAFKPFTYKTEKWFSLENVGTGYHMSQDFKVKQVIGK